MFFSTCPGPPWDPFGLFLVFLRVFVMWAVGLRGFRPKIAQNEPLGADFGHIQLRGLKSLKMNFGDWILATSSSEA